MKNLRARQAFKKPSIEKREQKIHAVYVQKMQQSQEAQLPSKDAEPEQKQPDDSPDLIKKYHEALYEELWEKLFNSRNMKHHVFRKGDLLLMDQLHTTHRRSPVKRKIRKLWRCAFDYSNIDFT